MMRNILHLVIVILLIIGCNTDKNDDEINTFEILTFDKHELTINPSSPYQTMFINATGKFKIKVEGVKDNDRWLYYTLSENELTINALSNNDEVVKSALIIIYNEENAISDTLKITQPIYEERIALIKFYKALNGDEWTKNENWCSDKTISEWYGIRAINDAFVSSIWLPGDAYIEGELPSCITSLKNLRELCFEGTRMSGKLPSNIGDLTKLQHIAIKNCNFSGTIPESLKNCKELEIVDLSHNNFSDAIPEFFFQLPRLHSIELNHNKFKSFSMNSNPIEGDLVYMSIDNNEISSSIPENIFKIKTMQFIYANDNKISGTIPESIGDSRNLMILRLENNNITGKLPESMVNLQLLNDFSITNNYIDVNNTDYLKSNSNYSNWRFGNQNNNIKPNN